MKDFNEILANMSESELEMAIKEQDNITLKVLTEAVQKQNEVSEAQDKLIKAIEKTIYQVVEVFQQSQKENEAKLKVLAKSLDRIEKELGNRPSDKEE